jgi:hypothetical protein
VFGQPVTFTATVIPSDLELGTPTGSVAFKVDGAIQAEVPLDDQGQARITLDTLAVGRRTISAEYSGSTERFAPSSVALTQTVSKASTSLDLVSTQPLSAVGEVVTFRATVLVSVPGQGEPNGTVTFFVNGRRWTAAPVIDGVAELAIPFRAARPFRVAARYNGSANFSSSASTVRQQVKWDTTTYLYSSGNPSVYGQRVRFTALVRGGTLAGPKNRVVRGWVTFLVDGVPTITRRINRRGRAIVRMGLDAGDHKV